jgi:hypothetical protein
VRPAFRSSQDISLHVPTSLLVAEDCTKPLASFFCSFNMMNSPPSYRTDFVPLKKLYCVSVNVNSLSAEIESSLRPAPVYSLVAHDSADPGTYDRWVA